MTAKQEQEAIEKIMENYGEVLKYILTGEGEIPVELRKKLKLPKQFAGRIRNSYRYGKLKILQKKDLNEIKPNELEKLLEQVKLTPIEEKSIAYLNAKADMHIWNLTTKISTGIMAEDIQDKIHMYQTIREIIPDSIAEMDERYPVIEKLRDNSKDWERDWYRVAHTEMWDAQINGQVQAILDGESLLSNKGGKTLVYKRPAPNACRKCKELYLEKDGITPKVFELSELLANGTNYDLKQAEWKPVAGITHPNCSCPVSIVPNGYEFDKEGKLVKR